MTKTSNTGTDYRPWIAPGVLFLLVFAVYSNTFQAAWHLDDYPNIVHNSRLHLYDLRLDSISKSLSSRPSSFFDLYRPVACLTFALNWYFAKDNVLGYHLVNSVIHFLTAFILFLTVFNLYKTRNLGQRYPVNAYWISLLSAILWALNPTQTQAVTYIVQRMASLATLFYISGIYCYVKGRLSVIKWRQTTYFLSCALSYVLALGSKENAAILPLVLCLVEAVFFQTITFPKAKKTLCYTTAAVAVLFILALGFFFIQTDHLAIFKGYQNRSFTLSQRLMTEPRILIYYLSQLFYPVPHRLSIEHDIDISTSFFDPWTTIPAILLLALLFGYGLSQINKRPIVAFGIIFFFLNHLIESSVLPLELIFEHRNYLPSLFLFWPLAAGLIWLVDHYRQKQSNMHKILVCFVVLLVLGWGIGTYARNLAWKTEGTLWDDALKKAPKSARSAYNLAKHYYAKRGQFDEALWLYEKSLALNASNPRYSKAMSLNAMASIYYIKQDFEKVIELCRQALEINPGFDVARYNSVLALVKIGRWEAASEAISLLLARGNPQVDHLLLKGFILLKLNRPEAALSHLRKALKKAPNNRKILLNIGTSLSLIKQYYQADWFFSRVSKLSPQDIRPYFYLIENNVKAGDVSKIEHSLEKLLAAFSLNTIIFKLNDRFDDRFLFSPSRELIAPVIIDKIIDISDEIARFDLLTADGYK